MKKYTQRELHNEAFRNMLANAGRGFVRGMGKVAKAVPGAVWSGIKTSVKNVGKHISPELASLGRKALNVYYSGRPDIAIKEHLEKNRTVPVYMSGVKEDKIIDGTISHTFKDTFVRDASGATVADDIKNSNTKRLKFKSEGIYTNKDDIVRIEFNADSGKYIAFFDQIDKNKLQLIAIKDA